MLTKHEARERYGDDEGQPDIPEWEPNCGDCGQLIAYIKTLFDDWGNDDEMRATFNEAFEYIKEMESNAIEAAKPYHEPDRMFL